MLFSFLTLSLWESLQNQDENSLVSRWRQVHSIFHASFVLFLTRYFWLEKWKSQRLREHPKTLSKSVKLLTKSSLSHPLSRYKGNSYVSIVFYIFPSYNTANLNCSREIATAFLEDVNRTVQPARFSFRM